MRALDFACRALGDDLIHSSSRLERALLGLLLPLLDLEALGLLLQPARVVALVGHALAAIELQRPFGDVVEEVAVVRHQHDAAGILLEIALEPGHRLCIQMVGRLVEQQDVGLGEQQLGQRHAPLLAARELAHFGIAWRTAQGIERLLHLRIEIPEALRLDLVLQLGHLLGGLVRIVGGEFVVAVDQRLLLGHALHGIAEHVLVGIELRLLRQIADAHAVGRPRLADEVLKLARHDLEQRRLARAVQADHADLGAGKERQRDVLQDLLAPRIGLGELVHVIDVLGVRHGRPRVADQWGLAPFYPGRAIASSRMRNARITWDSRMPVSPRAPKLGLVAGVLASLLLPASTQRTNSPNRTGDRRLRRPARRRRQG